MCSINPDIFGILVSIYLICSNWLLHVRNDLTFLPKPTCSPVTERSIKPPPARKTPSKKSETEWWNKWHKWKVKQANKKPTITLLCYSLNLTSLWKHDTKYTWRLIYLAYRCPQKSGQLQNAHVAPVTSLWTQATQFSLLLMRERKNLATETVFSERVSSSVSL